MLGEEETLPGNNTAMHTVELSEFYKFKKVYIEKYRGTIDKIHT